VKEALQAESSDALPTVLAIPAVSQDILQPGPVSGKQGFPTLHSVRVHPHQAPTIAAHLPALLELGLPPYCKVRSSRWRACRVMCFVFCLLLVGGYRLLLSEVWCEQQDDVSSIGKPMMCCTAVLLYCCCMQRACLESICFHCLLHGLPFPCKHAVSGFHIGLCYVGVKEVNMPPL
jgi:hypothetical protein